MTREIKFHGKDKKTGEWVYGDLVHGCEPQYAYIAERGNKELCRNYIEVIPETVGQFTGLYDSTKWEELTEIEQKQWFNNGKTKEEWNGKEIYEGNIVLTQEFRDKPYSSKAKKKRHTGTVEYKVHGGSGFYNPETREWDKFKNWDAEWTVSITELGEFTCSSWGDFFDCKVIGNIHDNSDLLK